MFNTKYAPLGAVSLLACLAGHVCADGIMQCPTVEGRTNANGQVYMTCPNSDYQGPTNQVLGGYANIAACAQKCIQTTGCVNAVFDKSGNGNCHLKGARNQLNWVIDNNFDSVRLASIAKCSVGETLITTSGGTNIMVCPYTDYQGPSVQVLPNVPSIAQCATICSQTANCVNSVWSTANVCHLKASRDQLTWTSDQGFYSSRVVPNSGPATGYRTVGSSGAHAQMVFLQSNSSKAIFIDNYHWNAGGAGYNIQSPAYGPGWFYPDSNTAVFGTEFDLDTTVIRALRPQTDTFCSAGAFFPDGTMLNVAGAEPGDGVGDGFKAIRTYAPGPCANNICNTDWVENGQQLKVARWYPTTQTLADGGIVIVGGSNAGGLVTNLAEINVPTYEKRYASGASTNPINLPILNFGKADNQNPRKSYNLYPSLHLLPNAQGKSLIFQVAATFAEIWDYSADKQYKALANTPNNQPRTFPSSSTITLLPIRLSNTDPTVLMCGGSSADIPNPAALNDCWRINPLTSTAWAADDNLPNGAQTMSDGVLLPDGTVLILNGGRKGSAGGFMADDPVKTPLLYNPSAARGRRFTSLPGTNIPRLYHAVAHLLPSGEVLIAGSNPAVGFSADGVPPGDPHFWNYNGQSYLLQQQKNNYPTEYRVEYFSPPYLNSPSRPIVTLNESNVRPGGTFSAQLNFNGLPKTGTIVAFLSNPGFSTHAMKMGQRMVEVRVVNNNGRLTITAPPNYSYLPAGYYLLFVNVNGIPARGQWVQLL